MKATVAETFEKNLRANQLMDFYLSLLTERSQEILTLYYREDMSLMEIAELLAISKQAVSDGLHSAMNRLEQYESNLHLCERSLERQTISDSIEQRCRALLEVIKSVASLEQHRAQEQLHDAERLYAECETLLDDLNKI